MEVIVLGTSTAFGYYGFAIVGHILDVLHGGHRRVHCLDAAQYVSGMGERRGEAVLVTTDRPDPKLAELMLRSGFPILAIFDDPADAIAASAKYDNRALYDAIRYCSRYLSCLASCTSRAEATFAYYKHDQSVGELIKTLAAAIGQELSDKSIAVVAERLNVAIEYTVEDALYRMAGSESLVQFAAQRFDSSQRGLIEQIAESYRIMLDGREAVVNWPRELFSVDAENHLGAGEVKLIGGARHIVWGPYLHLPIGSWRVQVEFEVAENVSGNEIEADVCVAETRSIRCSIQLPQEGMFGFSMDFTVGDPNDWIEIRMYLRRGAIEGRFKLRSFCLQPIETILRRNPNAPSPIKIELKNDGLSKFNEIASADLVKSLPLPDKSVASKSES